jgi:hypothetical protein
MNERIRQLLSQAGVHYEVLPKDTVYEKFAELIVKDCIDCVDDLIEPDPYGDTVSEDLYRAHNFALKQAMKHLSKRFGIK